MGREELKVNCPTCGKEVVWARPGAAPFFPFCSERCRLVDLGRWFDEEYRISESVAGRPTDDGPVPEQKG